MKIPRTSQRQPRSIAAAMTVALGFVALGSCAEQIRQPPTAAWVRESREAHEAADTALEHGDFDEARRVLRDALREAPPRPVESDHARIVRQDLYYRLAYVELEAGDPAATVQWANEGLNMGRAHDVFTSNLLIARGRGKHALGQEIEATVDYHDAMIINEQLLAEALDDADTSETRE